MFGGAWDKGAAIILGSGDLLPGGGVGKFGPECSKKFILVEKKITIPPP